MAEHRNGYVKRYNVDKNHKDWEKTPNYDFKVQDEPDQRMGNDGFANLPDKPMLMTFKKSKDYRSGVINSFECSVEEISGIHENRVY